MMILVGAGLQLTTDNRIIPGGPQTIVLGPGMAMDSCGNITDESPKWSVPEYRPISVVGEQGGYCE